MKILHTLHSKASALTSISLYFVEMKRRGLIYRRLRSSRNKNTETKVLPSGPTLQRSIQKAFPAAAQHQVNMAKATTGSHAGSHLPRLHAQVIGSFGGTRPLERLKFQVVFLHELLMNPTDNLSLLALPSW